MRSSGPSPEAWPTYEECIERSAALRGGFVDARCDYEDCTTLEALESLVGRLERPIPVAPWIAWIASGPPTRSRSFFSEAPSFVGNDEPEDRRARLGSVLATLIRDGASLEASDPFFEGERAVPPIALIAGLHELTATQRAELVASCIERGADPTERLEHPWYAKELAPIRSVEVTHSALDVALEQEDGVLLGLLEPRVSREALADAWQRRLVGVCFRERPVDGLRGIDALIERSPALDRSAPAGGTWLTPLLAACANAHGLDVMTRLLERGVDVDRPLAGPLGLVLPLFILASTGGVTLAQDLFIPPGTTALGLADRALAHLKRARAEERAVRGVALDRARVEALHRDFEEKRALLSKNGARAESPPAPPARPAAIRAVDEAMPALARSLGADAEHVAKTLAAAMPVERGLGPLGYLRLVMPTIAAAFSKIDPAASPVLAALFDVASGTVLEVPKGLRRSLEPEGRRRLGRGIVIALDEEAVWLALRGRDDTEIWELGPRRTVRRYAGLGELLRDATESNRRVSGS